MLATLIVVQAWRVDAAPGDSDSTFVALPVPLRILDTRSDVGLTGPFTSPTPRTLQVTGAVATTTAGSLVVVPAGATGVAMNVTVDRPTANGFVAVRPGDATGPPAVSSLNFPAGAPTANKVDVALPASGPNTGTINITYDAYGIVGPTTHVLVDIIGYYSNTTLTDLQQRLAAIETAQPFAVTARDDGETVENTPLDIVAVTVTGPAAGQVTVNSTTRAYEYTPGDEVACSISEATTPPTLDDDHLQVWESAGDDGDDGQLAGTRMFDIAADEVATYQLVCEHSGTSANARLDDSVLTAIFTPAP